MLMELSVTVSALRTIAQHECVLWRTPEGGETYWAANRQWTNDVMVATPEDFLDAAGFDGFDGLDDEELLTLVI